MQMISGILSLMSRSAPELRASGDAEGELVRRAQGGDRDALGALLSRYASDVYSLCHHVAGPRDGRDAAQQALEKIVARFDRYRTDKGPFRTWALAVARNTCRDLLRRRGLERGAFAADGDERAAVAASRAPSPERVAIARVEADALAEALAALPEKMRSAVVLFHVHGASYEEIAAALEVPKGTVMTWLHRGRRRLRAVLEERR